MFKNPSIKLKNAAAWIFGIQLLMVVILLVSNILMELYLIGIIAAAVLFLSAWYTAILQLTLCDAADQAQQAAYQAGECTKRLNVILQTIEKVDTNQMPTWKKVEMTEK